MLEAFLVSTVAMATPLLLAALGELAVEHSGTINIGIEGIMLAAAFAAMAAAYFSHSLAAGVVAGVMAALVMSTVLAVLVINLAVNQVVAGTALDIFALGLTGVLYRHLFGATGQAFTVAGLPKLPLGALARLPILGPALFDRDFMIYVALALVPLVHLALYRTRWGLRLRAAGERPQAADALGLGVYSVRWQAMLISGVFTGLAGAYLTLGYADTFVEGMSAGRGFVALAIVIVGHWSPGWIAVAAIFFGAATALQFTLQASGSAIPYQFFLALPYLLTLVVLTCFGAQSRAPSALGEPYFRQ